MTGVLNAGATVVALVVTGTRLQYGDADFRFITTPDIEPTNHLAEQTIRRWYPSSRANRRTL